MKNIIDIIARNQREVMLFAGISILGTGIALISIPASLFVSGAILVYVSIFGVR